MDFNFDVREGLTTNELIRHACLDAAMDTHRTGWLGRRFLSPSTILRTAELYEKFIKGEDY